MNLEGSYFPANPMSLAHLLEEPATDPTSLYRYRDGIVAADLLGAAIAEFDFFTWLADHPSTLGAICAHFQITPRPTDVMMTLFTAQHQHPISRPGAQTEHSGAGAKSPARFRVENGPWVRGYKAPVLAFRGVYAEHRFRPCG